MLLLLPVSVMPGLDPPATRPLAFSSDRISLGFTKQTKTVPETFTRHRYVTRFVQYYHQNLTGSFPRGNYNSSYTSLTIGRIQQITIILSMAQKVLRFFGAYSTTGKCACRINHLSPYGQIFLGSELKSISRPDHGYNP